MIKNSLKINPFGKLRINAERSRSIKNLKLKILPIGLFVYLFIGLFLPSASAQETQRNMTIVPPIVRVSLNPGQKTEGILKVINDSTAPLTFTAGLHDFIVDNPNGIPNLLPLNTLSKRFSGASWIAIDPSVFTVDPGQKQVLNYYLQIPQNARPGGHYAAVVYTPTANMAVKGTGAAVQTEIGTLFLITVNGNIKENAQITKFSANPFQEYGPVRLNTEILNNGDLHIRPIGEITVTDIFGQTVGKQNISQFDIFPTASRIYTNSIGKKIMIGPFKAKLLAYYGRNDNLPLTATVYFWVFPWKIATIAILIIILLILAIMYWRKRNSTNTQNNANKENEAKPISSS